MERVKKLFQNREATQKAIDAVMKFLAENMEEFKKLSFEQQFDLAMRFFQCERGRLQKGKMFLDIIFRFGPLATSIVALVLALKK